MGKEDKVLAEIFSAAGKYILEGGKPPKLSGDPSQAKIIHRATLASRRLYEALCDENSSLDAIAVMVDEKRRAEREFQSADGREWRL